MAITIDGGILAGGLSSRMEGQDKGLQCYRGIPMVESVAAALEQTENLLISCNQNQTQYQEYGKICEDLITGHKGPLAGIHSLLSASEADYVLIAPCDTPNLGPDYFDRMATHLTSTLFDQANSKKLFAVKVEDKHHPLHLLIHTSYKSALELSLKKNELKAMRWVQEQGVEWVDFSDSADAFSNINTLQELKS